MYDPNFQFIYSDHTKIFHLLNTEYMYPIANAGGLTTAALNNIDNNYG